MPSLLSIQILELFTAQLSLLIISLNLSVHHPEIKKKKKKLGYPPFYPVVEANPARSSSSVTDCVSDPCSGVAGASRWYQWLFF